jgi:SAM-dependent methyltransferase
MSPLHDHHSNAPELAHEAHDAQAAAEAQEAAPAETATKKARKKRPSKNDAKDKSKDKGKAKKKAGKQKAKKSKKPEKASARSQSKHRLYQLSVQAPDSDAEFLYDYFEKITGRRGHRFREDFCGTAILSCHWTKLSPENTAVGVDIDRRTLNWGLKNNVGDRNLLTEDEAGRITLIESDVLDVIRPKVDLIAALNFSYSFFMTRDELRAYMKRCRTSLVDDGVLFFDSWGGSQTQEVMEEEREVESDDVETFTYVWDQADFDPISYQSECRIHFRFEDGKEMRNAFKYRWRQWTLPELRELMIEAGFHDVHILWEGTDPETQEGDGEYTRQERGEADLGWIAYVVGHKNPID